MTLIDNAINGATDRVRAATGAHDRAQRRRAHQDQIVQQQALIAGATARIGRLALDAAARGRALPPAVAAALPAVHVWEADAVALAAQLDVIDRQLASFAAAPPG